MMMMMIMMMRTGVFCNLPTPDAIEFNPRVPFAVVHVCISGLPAAM